MARSHPSRLDHFRLWAKAVEAAASVPDDAQYKSSKGGHMTPTTTKTRRGRKRRNRRRRRSLHAKLSKMGEV